MTAGRWITLFAAALLAAGAAAPAAAQMQDLGERMLDGAIRGALEELSGPSPEAPVQRDGRGRGVRIPPGHHPPPGHCRVWFPDRPPGRQPPPGSCNIRVPRGAVLVRG